MSTMHGIDEPIKAVTLYEHPETDEAKYLLDKKENEFKTSRTIFRWTILVCFLLTFITISTMIPFIPILFALCTVIIGIVYIFIKSKQNLILAPYKELYRIAKHNDQIRNEERIRFRERQRLENQQDNTTEQVSSIQIKETIDKINSDNEKILQLIKQIKLPPKPDKKQ